MRTSVEIGDGSYLATVAHGARSGYIRIAVGERVARVRAALAVLRAERSMEEIVSIVDAMDLPHWKVHSATDMPALSEEETAAAMLLAAESEATGLEPTALLEVLDNGSAA